MTDSITNSAFYNDIKNIIVEARTAAIRSVDFQRVLMYWHLGKRIFLEEQHGEERAEYGTYLLKNLAQVIEPEFGSGFSVRQLERARQFYRVFPIASALRTQFNWMQYKLLIAIDDTSKREYYEDLGQLQMYVNYFNRYEKLPDENPTVGILLCAAKNDTLVKITLPEGANILASQYRLYLPSEQELTLEIEKERKLIKDRLAADDTAKKPIEKN